MSPNTTAVPTFKKRRATAAPRQVSATPPAAADHSDSDSGDADGGAGGDSDTRAKRRRTANTALAVSSANTPAPEHHISPSNPPNPPLIAASDATRHDTLSADVPGDPKNPKNPRGPVRAPANVRTVTVMDYAPDVCKDYKQTGFCGFGDNCKFLHSREDYKQSWSLDREWEDVTRGKTNLGGTVVASAASHHQDTTTTAAAADDDGAEEALLENIPFVCLICRGPYRAPIITRCGHYFCEPCALQRYRRDPSCAQCGAGTNGVFNTGQRLQALLARKRERAREEAGAEGEDGGEEEEEEEEVDGS